jgi:hypothetical protein
MIFTRDLFTKLIINGPKTLLYEIHRQYIVFDIFN